MRTAVAFVLATTLAFGQFRSMVPLVVAPTAVTNSAGRPIVGLDESDFVLYDNNVRQKIHMDDVFRPVSLVVVIQTSANSDAVVSKLGGSGILLTDLVAAEGGESAIVSAGDEVKLAADFTSDSDRIAKALRGLRARGEHPQLLAGIAEALKMIAARGNSRRGLILVVGERFDRSGTDHLPALLRNPLLQSTTIYWLTYSPFLTAFTAKPKRLWDTMTDEQKNDPKRMQGAIKYPWPEETVLVPPDWPSGSLFNIFTELSRRAGTDLAETLSQATGGNVGSFLKQSGLETAIHAVADQVHTQYMITFSPKPDAPGVFHSLRVEIASRPDAKVDTRSGYWSVE
jgi:VWFA-related protein